MRKPGLQALANTAPDRPPVAHKHSTVRRDHEYKRLGTCSILAARWILHDGHVMPPASNGGTAAASSSGLLKDLDTRYPAELAPSDWSSTTIRHTSRKKRGAFTPHAPQSLPVCTDTEAWIVAQHRRNAVRQNGKDLPAPHPVFSPGAELRQRILQGIAEINAAPVVHRWRKFDALKPADQEMV